MREERAEDLATGIAVLGAWGMAIQAHRGRRLLGVAIGAGESAFFGILVVTLKVLVH
jgi:hypothetical protein